MARIYTPYSNVVAATAGAGAALARVFVTDSSFSSGSYLEEIIGLNPDGTVWDRADALQDVSGETRHRGIAVEPGGGGVWHSQMRLHNAFRRALGASGFTGNNDSSIDQPIGAPSGSADQLFDIAFDAAALGGTDGVVYWSEAAGGLWRANYAVTSGGASDGEVALTSGESVRAASGVFYLAVGAAGVYFAEVGVGVRRIGRDLTGLVTLASTSTPSSVALDEEAGHLYWADYGTGNVHRAALDGTGAAVWVTCTSVSDIALDKPGNRLLVADPTSATVRAFDLTTKAETAFFTEAQFTPRGLDLQFG